MNDNSLRHRQFHLRQLLPALAISALAFSPANASAEELIPYQEFTLDNGLTLIVHEDRKAPIVAVNVWYHVGSKNEVEGKTGFAHLFEHLMFQGSENYKAEYLQTLENLGASDLNGTTWFDRTNYYETVPKGALDRVLFLESDRMGHLLGVIDQAVLDEQRGVVQNEKRQSDNQPYNKVWEPMLRQVFPGNHPYSWETIGSMDDLNAATLEDVREWFRTYYGPNNAVIAVAGDVDAAEVLEKVNLYFGDIPPGPPLSKMSHWVPLHKVDRREIIEDRVSQPRLYMAWSAPAWGTEDSVHMRMAATLLGQGKNSRLYQRLVYEDQIATDVTLATTFWEIAGLTYLQVSAKPGVTLAVLEAAAREEIERFMKNGPTPKELKRVKAQYKAAFISSLENIGGQPSKSALLAKNKVYGGSPDYYKKFNVWRDDATAQSVRNATRDWLGQGAYIAEVLPVEKLAANTQGYDRSEPPAIEPFESVNFPPFERRVLDNGLTLIVAERPAIPAVNMLMMFDAGYAADQLGKPGTAALTLSLLDEGTKKRSALQISEELALLGASVSASSDLDSANVSLFSLRETLDDALDIYADVILNPAFPEAEIERKRSQYLAIIRQEKTRPTSMALRVMPKLIYGETHAYSQPLTGSGTEASVNSIARDDLTGYHDTWFTPNNGTLVVVGDITMEEIAPRVEKLFRNWKQAEVPQKNIAAVDNRAEPSLYIIDKPGAEQSIIFAARLIPAKAATDDVAIKAMNNILGGLSSSRINMNLREDKHWSYGSRSLIIDTQAQRPFLIYAPVQTDKTFESVSEIQSELNSITGSKPATSKELGHLKNTIIRSIPGGWETGGAVLGDIAQLVRFGLPDNYWDNYATELEQLGLDNISAAADIVVKPEELVWVIVGDRSKIEGKLTGAGLGAIKILDADGNPVSR